MRAFYILLITILVSCNTSEKEELYITTGNAFGTTFSIQYYSEKEINIEKGIDSVIYKVNKSVSTYMPKSDISKINKGDSTVVVDDIFKEVFRISEIVYTNSNGYFDPTIGVLRNAYGFGDVQPVEKMDSLVLDSLRKFVGFRKVSLLKDGTIQKKHPEIYFDFNAVAKGYGIDCIAKYLGSLQIDNYIIELGGELVAKGLHLEKKKPWVVGIEAIESDIENRSYEARLKLENSAMASSGNYRKYRIDPVSGKKFVHTLNPLTGTAEQSNITSASVLASTCGFADAYATAFMALGLDKSKELLKSLDGIEAYLTYNDSLNKPQVFMTDGFKNQLLD